MAFSCLTPFSSEWVFREIMVTHAFSFNPVWTNKRGWRGVCSAGSCGHAAALTPNFKAFILDFIVEAWMCFIPAVSVVLCQLYTKHPPLGNCLTVPWSCAAGPPRQTTPKWAAVILRQDVMIHINLRWEQFWKRLNILLFFYFISPKTEQNFNEKLNFHKCVKCFGSDPVPLLLLLLLNLFKLSL